jgi:Fungal specific transcription factor domain
VRPRIRRVKCDEEKPYCNRCSSTGRKCDGYQFESRAVSTKLVHNVSMELPGTRKERRAFEFFRSCTASSICNYFPEEFWERNVLQASFSQPCLRHAAIAIGSLHESLSRDLMENGSHDARDNLFALRQYSKAITHLSGSLSKNKQYSTVALMCCILFVAFDSLLDQSELAITHLRSGLEILRNHESAEINHFHHIFTRMSITSIIYLGSKPRARPLYMWELPDPHYSNPPAKFSTMFEARNCLNSIHESMFRSFFHISKPANRDFTGTWLSGTSVDHEHFLKPPMTEGPQVMPPLSTAALKAKYVTALKRWSHAFEAYLRDLNQDMSGQDLRGALLLKIHQCMAMIMISTDLSEYRPSYELFAAGFKTIINLCQALTKTEVQAHRMLCAPALGIIGPLYYTALNCHDEHLRRRAMELLAIPRREGVLDSRTAAALAAARARPFRRNSSSSISSIDSTRLASLSHKGSDESLWRYSNDPFIEKGIVTPEDWNTSIWDVFPALAAIRPHPEGPVHSNEFTISWTERNP